MTTVDLPSYTSGKKEKRERKREKEDLAGDEAT